MLLCLLSWKPLAFSWSFRYRVMLDCIVDIFNVLLWPSVPVKILGSVWLVDFQSRQSVQLVSECMSWPALRGFNVSLFSRAVAALSGQPMKAAPRSQSWLHVASQRFHRAALGSSHVCTHQSVCPWSSLHAAELPFLLLSPLCAFLPPSPAVSNPLFGLVVGNP